MTKKLSMFNWICIIALATAAFISHAAVQQKQESRPTSKVSHKQSIQIADWEIDHPLMLLFTSAFLPGNDLQVERPSSSVSKKELQ